MSNAGESNVSFPALRDPRYPVHRIADRLEPYLQNLVRKVHPEKIILFGSQANGEPTENSDIDLLVIRRAAKSMLESNLEVRRAFRDAHPEPLSFSIISLTPEAVQEKLARHEPLFAEIFRHGLELYAA
jgi:uncharacterized protein